MVDDFDFILSEYDQMFEEKRYYDSRFTFFISLYFSIITICVSIMAFVNDLENKSSIAVLTVQIFMPLLLAIFGIIIAMTMCFTRINYVKTLRQINAIRIYLLNKTAKDFIDTNLLKYGSRHPKFYRVDSMQLVFIYSIIALNSVFVTISLYFSLIILCLTPVISAKISVVTFILFLIVQVALFVYRLKKKDSDKKKKKRTWICVK